jgi:hypothetical protein
MLSKDYVGPRPKSESVWAVFETHCLSGRPRVSFTVGTVFVQIFFICWAGSATPPQSPMDTLEFTEPVQKETPKFGKTVHR